MGVWLLIVSQWPIVCESCLHWNVLEFQPCRIRRVGVFIACGLVDVIMAWVMLRNSVISWPLLVNVYGGRSILTTCGPCVVRQRFELVDDSLSFFLCLPIVSVLT